MRTTVDALGMGDMDSQFLLDTGVFYRLAGRQGGLANLADIRSRLWTTPTSVLEITLGMTSQGEFAKRRRALLAFADACGTSRTAFPVSDARVSSAFGIDRVPLPQNQVEQFIEAAITCCSFGAFLGELSRRPTVREAFDILVKNHELNGRNFAKRSNQTNAGIRAELAAMAKEARIISDREASREARATFEAVTLNHGNRRRYLASLAVRAGLIDPRKFIEASRVLDVDVLDAMAAQAAVRYDGSLNFVIDCHLVLIAKSSAGGRDVAGNDLFDIDQLVYMSDGNDVVFVSTDAFLVSVVNDARPGRAVRYEDWIGSASSTGGRL